MRLPEIENILWFRKCQKCGRWFSRRRRRFTSMCSTACVDEVLGLNRRVGDLFQALAEPNLVRYQRGLITLDDYLDSQ